MFLSDTGKRVSYLDVQSYPPDIRCDPTKAVFGRFIVIIFHQNAAFVGRKKNFVAELAQRGQFMAIIWQTAQLACGSGNEAALFFPLPELLLLGLDLPASERFVANYPLSSVSDFVL